MPARVAAAALNSPIRLSISKLMEPKQRFGYFGMTILKNLLWGCC